MSSEIGIRFFVRQGEVSETAGGGILCGRGDLRRYFVRQTAPGRVQTAAARPRRYSS